MKCPKCQSTESSVIDSRANEGGNCIRRRRKCQNCGEKWTTYEFTEIDLGDRINHVGQLTKVAGETPKYVVPRGSVVLLAEEAGVVKLNPAQAAEFVRYDG